MWGATHKDAGSIPRIYFGIDEFKNHHAAVEGDDFTVLRSGGLSRRANVVVPALAPLQTELLQLCRIGKVHHHAAARALADHERLLALSARVGFGTSAILRLVIGCVAPTSDDFGGADARRDFRWRQRDGRCLLLRVRCAGRNRDCRARKGEGAKSARSHRELFPELLPATSGVNDIPGSPGPSNRGRVNETVPSVSPPVGIRLARSPAS